MLFCLSNMLQVVVVVVVMLVVVWRWWWWWRRFLTYRNVCNCCFFLRAHSCWPLQALASPPSNHDMDDDSTGLTDSDTDEDTVGASSNLGKSPGKA